MNNTFLIKYILSFLAVLLFFFSTPLSAQLNIGGQPYSFSNELRDDLPIESMAPIDLAALELEDKRDEESNLPYRFGKNFETNLNLKNSGIWTVLENGDRIWRLMIECTGAHSINLTYSQFWLPEGAVLYIYSPDKSEILGGFTSRNNKGTKTERKGFATSFIKQDQMILEYYEPAREIGNGVISINKVVHGYRTANNNNRDFGESDDCNVNINCDEADDYQDAKRAVALVIVNGNRVCSGALVTNTCQNAAPFFLTADHCFDESDQDAYSMPDDPTLMFLWNYESTSTDCNDNGSDFTPPSTIGARMLANAVLNSLTDFALLFLTENPTNLSGVDPFYLGWDRAGVTPGGGICIHHPRGDIKKFNEEPESLTSTEYLKNLPISIANYWRVNDWETGVAEPGSSGAPLLRPGTNLIVGQLRGGNTKCSDNIGANWFGKFSVSWDHHSVNHSSRRLRDWLGACNPNIVVMGGMDGLDNCTPDLSLNGIIGSGTYNASNSISSAATIFTSMPTNYHAGSVIDLNPGFSTEAGVDFLAEILPCSPFGSGAGTKSNGESSSSNRTIDNELSSSQLKVYPNPTSSSATVEFTLTQANVVELTLVDLTGRTIQTLSYNQNFNSGTHQMTIDGSPLHPGVYFIYLKIENKMPLIEKLIVN